jgi:hypothetical protein
MRFTIRDLLWLMAFVGVVAAWQIDRSRLEVQRQSAASESIIFKASTLRLKDEYQSLRELTAPYFACYPAPCLFCGRRPGDSQSRLSSQQPDSD